MMMPAQRRFSDGLALLPWRAIYATVSKFVVLVVLQESLGEFRGCRCIIPIMKVGRGKRATCPKRTSGTRGSKVHCQAETKVKVATERYSGYSRRLAEGCRGGVEQHNAYCLAVGCRMDELQ